MFSAITVQLSTVSFVRMKGGRGLSNPPPIKHPDAQEPPLTAFRAVPDMSHSVGQQYIPCNQPHSQCGGANAIRDDA